MTTVTGYIRDQEGDLLADAVVRLYRRDTGALLGSAVAGDGTEEQVGDTDFASVSLLLHCDGADSSTTFTDSSPTPKTVTAGGNAHVETDQSKFGGASAYFDGSGDYLSIPSSTSLNFGTGDYTAECWVRLNSATVRQILLAFGSGGFSLAVNTSGNIEICRAMTAIDFTATAGMQANTWTHIAASRSGTSLKVFKNGEVVGTFTSSTNYSVGTSYIGIDANGSSDPLAGYLDDIRITKGVARYTSAFTPPNAPFFDSDTIPGKPLGLYSIDTTYSGEVQRIVCAPDAWDPITNDLIDRIILP